MGIGGLSGLPFLVGGGDTDEEEIYAQLRNPAIVGEGDVAVTEDGIDALWRKAKATAIAAALSAIERANEQAFPGHATDHIPVYEEILRIAQEDTLVERQRACETAWCLQISAEIPTIRAGLQAIDPALDVQSTDYDQAAITMFGKLFKPIDGLVPYGSGLSANRLSAAYPNVATDFCLLVAYQLAPGQIRPSDAVLAAVAHYLNDVLPAWVDWWVFTGPGFYLDGGVDGTSLMDITAFS